MVAARNHFEVLGLPPTFFVDRTELEQRYRDRQRHTHPDRFSRAPAAERADVLRRATDLNDAYRILKSDARRAEYLLALRGVDLSEGAERAERAEQTGQAAWVKRTLDPTFLADVLELREELQEAQQAHDAARVAALSRTVAQRMGQENELVAAGFSRLEQQDVGDPAVVHELADALLKQRYYQRFLDEIASHEDASL